MLWNKYDLLKQDGYEPFMENSSLDENSENLCQRLTFYSVPIPGESEWVKTVSF